MATAEEEAHFQEVFTYYDRHGTGSISVEELRNMLYDMGLLANKGIVDQDTFVVQQFVAADRDKDNKLSYEEFVEYYAKVSAPKLSQVLAEEMPEKLNQLKEVFLAYAGFGSRQVVEDMDSTKFAKVCKDSKLVGRGLATTDVDLIFLKVKERGDRRITFDQFLHALSLVGEKKGMEVPDLIDMILEVGGPVMNSSARAEYTRFHDDKSTYTGVYVRGGPSSHDVTDLSQIVRHGSGSTPEHPRRPATAAASAAGGTPSPEQQTKAGKSSPGGASPSSRSSTPGSGRPTPGMVTPSGSYVAGDRRAARASNGESAPPSPSSDPLRDVFCAFATFGSGSNNSPPGAKPTSPNKVEIDSVRLVKLCRESGLLAETGLATARVDLFFTKIRGKARKINYKQFLDLVELLAQEAGITGEEARDILCSVDGPGLNNVTKVEYNRFHDDKTTYTGVYARGGPTVGDEITPERLVSARRRATPT